MGKVQVLDHPLLQHKLSILRDKNTGVKEFREIVGEIAALMCYEATRNLPTEEVEIETPVAMAKTKVLSGKKLAIVHILKKEYGCRYLTLMDIIAAPEGVKAVTEAHPDVDLYVAAVDDHLNEHAYIVPGLGDAGDRIFGTK